MVRFLLRVGYRRFVSETRLGQCSAYFREVSFSVGNYSFAFSPVGYRRFVSETRLGQCSCEHSLFCCAQNDDNLRRHCEHRQLVLRPRPPKGLGNEVGSQHQVRSRRSRDWMLALGADSDLQCGFLSPIR